MVEIALAGIMGPMIRTTCLFLLLCTAGAPSLARATEEELQFRMSANLSVPITDSLDASLSISQRYRKSSDQFLVRVTLDKQLSDRVSIGGGLARSKSGGFAEVRPHQQIRLQFGAISFRTRLEQRFFEAHPRTEIRLRQRVQARLPVDDRTHALAGAEVVYVVQSRFPGLDGRISGARASIELRRQLSEQLSARIGYRLSHSWRNAMPDQRTHSPTISLGMRF